jgi:hypothetical protein
MYKYTLVIILLVLLSGCSGGSSGTSAITYNASAYFNKTAVGNNWNLTGTYSETGTSTASGSISDVYRNISFAGGVVTQTDTYTIDGTASAPSTYTNFLAADGSLVTESGSSTFTSLPATFSIGTTWTAQPENATSLAVTGAVIGINVSCSSNNATFTDCIHIRYIGSNSGTGAINYVPYASVAPYVLDEYYSPTVGQYVQTSYSSITTYTGSKTGVLSYNDSEVLQAGYVAN